VAEDALNLQHVVGFRMKKQCWRKYLNDLKVSDALLEHFSSARFAIAKSKWAVIQRTAT
jgi:hypothetical protein